MFCTKLIKRLLSCTPVALSVMTLAGASLTTPALAEVKETAKQGAASLKEVVQNGVDGACYALNSITGSAQGLFATQEESTNAAEAKAGSVSTTDGVTWNADFTVCTLGPTSTGSAIDSAALKNEISDHSSELLQVESAPGGQLGGNIGSLFRYCGSLRTVDLSNLVPSSVSNTSFLFMNCFDLARIDISTLDTSTVTYMNNMFEGCQSLTDLDLSNLDTGSATTMESMFSGCASLGHIQFSDSFNTGSVATMTYMFENCSSLATLQLPGAFNTGNVTEMFGMFKGCGFTQLTLPDAFNTEKVEDMQSLFKSCKNLEAITLPDAFSTESVLDTSEMFCFCTKLKRVTFPDAFKRFTVSFEMFYGCESLEEVTFPQVIDAEFSTNMGLMFDGCSSLKAIHFPLAVSVEDSTDMVLMFGDCSQLESIDLSMFSYIGSADFTGMFANCDNLKEVNLGRAVVTDETGEATNGLAMFVHMDLDSGSDLRSLSNITKITMLGSCILQPGAGSSLNDASGTFFNYKEPGSWEAFYMGDDTASTSNSTSSYAIASDTPDAVLTGFDEFRAYQETHPGLTTYHYVGDVPPGPTPEPAPSPDADSGFLPGTGDATRNIPALFALSAAALLCGAMGVSRKRARR